MAVAAEEEVVVVAGPGRGNGPEQVVHTPNIGLDTPYDGTIYGADSNGNVTFKGKIDADYSLTNVSISLYVDNQDQTVTADASGNFSMDLNLAEGQHKVFASATAVNSETGEYMTAFSTDRDVWVDTTKPENFKITGPNFLNDYYLNNPWIWGYNAANMSQNAPIDWPNGFTSRTRFTGTMEDNGNTPTMPFKVQLGSNQASCEPSSFAGKTWEADYNLRDAASLWSVLPNEAYSYYYPEVFPPYTAQDAALNTTSGVGDKRVFWCPIILNPRNDAYNPSVRIAVQKGDEILVGVTGGVPEVDGAMPSPFTGYSPSGLVSWLHQDSNPPVWQSGDPWVFYSNPTIDACGDDHWQTSYSGYAKCTKADGTTYGGSDQIHWDDDAYFHQRIYSCTGKVDLVEGTKYDVLKLRYDTSGSAQKIELQNYTSDGYPLKRAGFDDDPDYQAEVTVYDIQVDLYLADGTLVSDLDRQTKEFPFRLDNDDVDENGVPDYQDQDFHPNDMNAITIVVHKPNPDTGGDFVFQTGGLSAFAGAGRVFRQVNDSFVEYTGESIPTSELPVTFFWQGGKYGMLQGKGVFSVSSQFDIKKKLEFDLRGHQVEPKIQIPGYSAKSVASRDEWTSLKTNDVNVTCKKPWNSDGSENFDLQRVIGQRISMDADIAGCGCNWKEAVVEWEWVLQGEPIGGYSSWNRNKGEVAPLVLNNRNITFYWWKNGDSEWSTQNLQKPLNKISCAIKYSTSPSSSQIITSQTWYHVEEPKAEMSAQSSEFTYERNADRLTFGNQLSLDPGIVFTADIYTGPRSSGTYSFLQILTNAQYSWHVPSRGDFRIISEGGKYYCDQFRPGEVDWDVLYPVATSFFDPPAKELPIGINESRTAMAQDSPSMYRDFRTEDKKSLKADRLGIVGSFNNFFVFKPDTGHDTNTNIYVPLLMVSWNCHAIYDVKAKEIDAGGENKTYDAQKPQLPYSFPVWTGDASTLTTSFPKPGRFYP